MRLFLQLNEDTDKILKAVRAGYGGRFHDNILADRRDHENLHPVPKDDKLGIPEPKKHDVRCRQGIIRVNEGTIRVGEGLATINDADSYECEWCRSKSDS